MNEHPAHDEIHYRLLRLLESEPHLSQRDIARRLDISLGKANYCVRALAEKGWVKAGNFYRSKNKRAYLYKLTPRGVAEKAAMTLKFLRIKEAEHQTLLEEIEVLREEAGRDALTEEVKTVGKQV